MAGDRVRELELGELCRDARPPRDDEGPRALDGTRLDRTDKLLAYPEKFNDRSESARGG